MNFRATFWARVRCVLTRRHGWRSKDGGGPRDGNVTDVYCGRCGQRTIVNVARPGWVDDELVPR